MNHHRFDSLTRCNTEGSCFCFGTAAGSNFCATPNWINLHKQYELGLAEQEGGQKIREPIPPRAAA